MGVPELVESGIRAYLAGREEEAFAAFQEVLREDPGNAKARWYVERMGEASAAAAGSRRGAAKREPGGAAPGVDVHRLELDLELDASEAPTPAPAGPSGSAPDERRDEEYAPSPWDEGPAAAAPIELEASGGLDLGAIAEKSDLRPLVPERVGAQVAARTDVEVWLSAAKELFALGDFSGSLELIEKILHVDPEHGEARDYLRQNEATLISMYESKLGPLTAIPRLSVKPEEILWLNLDHRAGFLLAQIDGTVDYESLFALSGLPRLDTARILANLIADGVIGS
jgi:tetratricopeptide (TPR) repeat protein